MSFTDDGSADDESDAQRETESESTADSEPESEPVEEILELVGEEAVDHEHACLHAEYDEQAPLEGGESDADAPTVDETHVIWKVTYVGDHGYVVFAAGEHPHSGQFGFYTADGSPSGDWDRTRVRCCR